MWRKLITLPVVVHVVHRTGEENISDAQIQSQIDVLNARFPGTTPTGKVPAAVYEPVADAASVRAGHQDPTAATTASRGPDDGLVRHRRRRQVARRRRRRPVAERRYLNMWVCNLGGACWATPSSRAARRPPTAW